MSQWRPKITPAVGGVAQELAKTKDLRQEFQENQARWRRRIAEKKPEDKLREEIASRWRQWSIENPGTKTAKLVRKKENGSHKQQGNVWFNNVDNPRQATLSLRNKDADMDNMTATLMTHPLAVGSDGMPIAVF